MNNFEKDDAAQTLANTRSAYNLAREVLDLRAEKDSLEDKVENLKDVIDGLTEEF